ncbi:MAG: thioredoxin [Acidimicrobiales bacterium]|nr:thioredoxin [Acidimicrobiales bacterium]
MADVTDATFQTAVMERSLQVPVVVDLWAPWCGPCKTLGPMIERIIANTNGRVELAKVNVDENPQVAQAFQVQSIPAVHAISGGQVVDSFMGAVPEAEIQAFVDKLLGDAPDAPDPIDQLVEAGDVESLQQALTMQPDHPGAVVAYAKKLVEAGQADDALSLLERIPESLEVRQVAAMARTGGAGVDDYEATFTALLPKVKTDDEARQQYVDLLDLLGPDDPRTAEFRKKLTNALY